MKQRKTPASGATSAAGYGWRHQQARARFKRIVDAGAAHCARCGGWINPSEPWDADHAEIDGAKEHGWYRGPAHRGCNRDLSGRTAERRRATTTPAKALAIFNTPKR